MKKRTHQIIALSVCIFVLSPMFSWAQLIIGQYEDEAPFRTWNTLGVPTASSLGIGEARFALAADTSAGLINPALLISLPRFSFTINGSHSAASFNKYSIVNTGVLLSQGNSSMKVYTIDFAGFSATYRDWAFGLSVGLLEHYERPAQNPKFQYQSQILYDLDFQQDGILRNYNISLARKLFRRLSLGIGINFVSGYFEKSIEENYFYNDVMISDVKTHDFKGYYVNGGIVVGVTDRLTAAAIFRTPYSKKAESESKLRYFSPRGNTDIRTEVSATSIYKQPLVLGVGFDYRLSEALRVASDMSYFNWSSYSVESFDEELSRRFKNIIKIGGGFEYSSFLHLFGQTIRVPLRAGVSYDPQPIKEPSTYYLYYTIGLGIYWRGIHLDAGAIFGNEKGSGHDLSARKLALSLSYSL
jgi:long-subunit fatty acid transport protein